MARRDVSESTRKGREQLKSLRAKRQEEKNEEREALDRMLGGRGNSGRPRRSQKRSTFLPGHHGNK